MDPSTDRNKLNSVFTKTFRSILHDSVPGIESSTLPAILPEMVFIIDRTDRIVFLNDEAAKQFNQPVQNLIGKIRAELFPPEVANKQSESLRKVFESEETIYEESLVKFYDSEIQLGTKLIPLRDESGNVSHVLGVSRDITELKIQEEIIERDEKLLKTIITNSPVIIFAIDEKGYFTHSDGKGLNSLGLKPGEAVGKSVREMFAGIDGIVENYEYALKGNSVAFITTIRDSTFEAYYSPKYDSAGNINGIVGIGIDVTQRRASEAQIQLLTSALEVAANGIVITDVDGKIIWVNHAFTSLTGYDVDEVLHSSPRLLKSEHHQPSFYQKMWQTILSGEVWQGEIVNRKKDGTIYYEEQTITPVKNYLGEITHFIAIKQDISDRKKTEQLIMENEEKYRSLFDRSRDGILLHDLDGEIVDGNVHIFELMGYHREELLKLNITDLDSNLSPDEKIRKELLEKGFVNFELEFKRKDGKFFQAEVISSLVEIGGEKLVQAIIRDITERKKTEAQLKESEERLRSFYENSMIGVYRSKPDGSIIMTNPSLRKMLGIDNIEQFNLNDLSENIYVDIDDRLKFQNTLERNGKVTGFETAYKRNDGKIIYTREYARAVKDQQGRVLYFEGTLEDITEKKEAEKAIVEAKNKAEKSDHLKTMFLAQMSHEIRTPINAILSFSNLIKDDVKDKISSDLSDSFQIIQSEGLRITRTIDLILNMSEIQTGTYDLRETEFDIVDDVIESIRKESIVFAKHKNLTVKINRKTKKTILKADNYSVYQIFTNLIDNAIKYTYVGGIEITISRNKTKQLVVAVTDTGIGISQEYLPSLFKPFSQEDIGYTRKFEGNGLGLALVKNYCDLNNATIEVESVKGEGTTFIITFQN